MYDNETGRFTTPDLLWSAFPAQTPYHYAYNSPLTYRDPTGLAPEKEKEREELMGLTPEDLDTPLGPAIIVEIDHSIMVDWARTQAIYGSRLADAQHEMQNWWMSSVYNWKGPARTTDYVSLKGNAKLSPNPNDKGNKTKQDLTKEFNEHLEKSDRLFREANLLLLREMPLFYNKKSKIILFGIIQYAGKDTDFLNPKQSKTYEAGGLYNNEPFDKDDFGNYQYGSAAFCMGLSIVEALMGAGAFGIINNSKKDYDNYFGLFDEKKDSQMIIRGYYRQRWGK